MTDADDVEFTFTVGELRRISELVTDLAGWCYCDGLDVGEAGDNSLLLYREKVKETACRLASYGIKVDWSNLNGDAE